MKKNTLVIVGENFPNKDKLSLEFIEHLSLFENSPEIVSNHLDLDDLKKSLAESKHPLLIIGNIPKILSSDSTHSFSGFTHLILDKYIFQTAPFILPGDNKNIIKIIEILYNKIKPGRVIVNNQVMKKDFEDAFNFLGIICIIKVTPHPMTKLIKNRRSILLSKNTGNDYKILHDSGFLIDTFGLGNLNNFILQYPPFADFDIKNTHKIIALLNYREQNGYFLSLYPRIKYFLGFKQGARKLFFAFFAKFNIILFNFLRFDYGHKFEVNINSRWKPNTKLTVAIGMGLPIVSIPEQSIIEFSNLYQYPAFYFTTTEELKNCIVKIDREFDDIQLQIEAIREEIIAEIQATFLDCLLY